MYNDCSRFLEHSFYSHSFLILYAAHRTVCLATKCRFASIVYPILTLEYLLFILYMVSYLVSIVLYINANGSIFSILSTDKGYCCNLLPCTFRILRYIKKPQNPNSYADLRAYFITRTLRGILYSMMNTLEFQRF